MKAEVAIKDARLNYFVSTIFISLFSSFKKLFLKTSFSDFISIALLF